MTKNGIPAYVEKRINAAYFNATRDIIKDNRKYLRLVQGVYSGKIKPPAYYVNNDRVEEWKEGFLREAQRQNAVIERAMKHLNAAGYKSAKLIQTSMVDLFVDEKKMQIDFLAEGAKKLGIPVSFGLIDKRAVAITIADKQPVFAKIAYNHLGENLRVRQRLQNELAQAIIKGEGHDKVVERIRNVVGEAKYNADRTAQTECTRVRAQARQEAAKEAEEQGLEIERVWHCRFHHTRDSHAAMEGQVVDGADTPFISGDKHELRFPGDPDAPASEVINCHCYVVSRVKSSSEAVRRMREEYQRKRDAWLAQNREKNNWRDGDDDEAEQHSKPHSKP